MSFGFSPGDIALFLGFAIKVRNALKEEGGSKSEYRLAQQQCQEFLDVMDDVKRLDLSEVPGSFRDEIEKYSTDTREFVNDFKRTICKYEKSMGKSSHRGFLTSAPKKVQWVFSAADDLEKFKRSLSAQVNLVHITIPKAILSIVAKPRQSQQLVQEPTRSNALSRGIYPASHRQGYLGWNYNQIDGLDLLGRVDEITDIVYEHFLARPRLPLADHGRIYTLPDDVSISVSYPQLETISDHRSVPLTNHSNQFPIPIQQQVQSANERTHSVDQNTLAGEINEYLRSLNLEELSEQEAKQVNQTENNTQRLLLNELGEESSEPLPEQTEINRDQPHSSGSGEKWRQKSKFRPTMPSFGSPTDALSGVSLAISIIQFIDSAAKTSFNIMRTENSYRELVVLSKRIMQYSNLLEKATSVICTSMSADQQRLAWEVIRDSEEAMREVGNILDVLTYRTETGRQKYTGLLRMLKWQLNKKRVLSLMGEVDSLKSTFSIVLQVHQIQISEHSLREIKYAREMQMETRRVASRR
ncbi:uncharacterized protein TRUGW13939_05719 [Talaromyces rugulosus]|uniref:Fungal N-terminal domain-containing protein n=1 Tax=Talaromyces rugulosus TaxID=121627 RepID=A0A7H8QWV8_TALRU|nr:uncharacterized protein TRUGW13939_05719 [Talaromyces rugulosus]QKX58594.1 hypothetical protein TRUGW13939_05719 [Talaromyces rugulosus]